MEKQRNERNERTEQNSRKGAKQNGEKQSFFVIYNRGTSAYVYKMSKISAAAGLVTSVVEGPATAAVTMRDGGRCSRTCNSLEVSPELLRCSG